jgi:hypothetical protein
MIVIPASDNLTSIIVLLGYKESSQTNSRSLYNDVSMALQAMQEPTEVSELWLPQFKFEDSIHTDALKGLTSE